KIFYKIQTTDDCDTLAFSNYGSTIYLTGTAQTDLTNFINWTAFDIKNATVSEYSIYRIVSGSASFLETVSATTTSYVDAVNPEKEAESNVCYFVVAHAEVTLPDGSTEFVESSSNVTCVEQLSSIIAPNAFAPQGRNQIFQPFIVFGETVDYHFSVYNRWGELLFETKNKSEGWNGKYKGKIQPMGAYIFHIKITQMNGNEVEKRGVFTLLR
ncbi:MAG TPA: T9SS type B sorting domain-containing protein, partial [Phaeodactylibacter sp.]|nr:T9SS type B sorting domain-containing protein [Phaeodactylibacter sp.]